jgi:HlyD family secretion protein
VEVLKVPSTALFRDGTRWALFVAEEGRARRRHVELGHRNGLEAEITRGVATGALVVLHPSDRIVADTLIAPRG